MPTLRSRRIVSFKEAIMSLLGHNLLALGPEIDQGQISSFHQELPFTRRMPKRIPKCIVGSSQMLRPKLAWLEANLGEILHRTHNRV